ncbi:unnamed protein product, partial [Adineta steineri]
TSYPHTTYLPTSQNEYTDWMHHYHTYRLPYSTNPTATTPIIINNSMSSPSHSQ